MTTSNRWTLQGEYFENCNCEVLCPCIVQGTGVHPPTVTVTWPSPSTSPAVSSTA